MEQTNERLHCSALPRFFDCASSILPTEAPYNPQSDVASLGTAAHEGAADIAVGRDPDVSALADRYECDETELSVLLAYARQAWKELGKYFPNPQVERGVSSNIVIGTADLLDSSGRNLVILDWKSGRIRKNATHQLAGYAHGGRVQFGMPKSGQITTIAVWLRFREYEVKHMDDAYLDDFEREFRNAKAHVGKQYGPGESCMWCPRQLDCKARDDFLRSSCAALTAVEPKELTPEKMAGLWQQSRDLKRALGNYEKAMKMLLQNGPLELPGGGSIGLTKVERTEIVAEKCWDTLKAHGFTKDEIAGCLSVSKKAVEETAKQRVRDSGKPKRGAIGAAAKAIVDDLDEAGALVRKEHDRVEVKK